MAPRSGIQWSPYEIVYRWPFQATIGVGDMHIDQDMKVKKYAPHVSQILAVTDDFACIGDSSPVGSLHLLEPGGKVLLKAWRAGSPENRLEEKWTGPWDILITTPTVVELAGIKPWIHHTRLKKALEEQWTTKPQENPSHLSETMTYVVFITAC